MDSRTASFVAAAVGLLVAMGGVEAWLGWWTDGMPGPSVAPTLGTLRGASTMDGLWDPTLQVDPELGWTLAQGAHPAPDPTWGADATVGRWANRLTGADDRPEAAHRVAIFGDSFVFGFGVADGDTFAARLAARLGEDWQITNHGVPGYGDDQVALALDRWMPVLEPDVVIVGHTADDGWRNGVGWSYAPKRRSRVEDGIWRVSPGPLLPPAQARDAWLARPLLRYLPRLLSEAWTYRGEADERALAEAILRADVARVREVGAEIVLIDLSILGAVPPSDGAVPSVCAAEGVSCLDTLAAQQAVRDAGGEVFRTQHYGAEVHERIARALEPLVLEAASASP